MVGHGDPKEEEGIKDDHQEDWDHKIVEAAKVAHLLCIFVSISNKLLVLILLRIGYIELTRRQC